ncbi:MAG: MotA/TolQ/ExbB proton channel family protein [bacterium]
MRCSKLFWCGLIAGLFLDLCFLKPADVLFAQKRYDLVISKISTVKLHKNWLFIPTSADLRVEWQLWAKEKKGAEETVIPVKPAALPLTYQVYSFRDTLKSKPVVRKIENAGFAVLPGNEVGREYFIRVRAFTADAKLLAQSGLASVFVGKGFFGGKSDGTKRDLAYYLNPGRWQLFTVGQAEIYDRSTKMGKAAFIFLSVSSTFSLFILIYYSTRTLYLGNIFPFRRSKSNLIWSFLLSLDRTYENRLTDKFKFVLQAWETIATKSRQVADRAANNLPNTVSSTEKLASVDVACMEYWTSDGDKAIGTIEDIISFPYINGHSNYKNPDDLLAELVIKIENSFHDLISQNGEVKFRKPEKVNMENLIDEIYEPVTTDEKLLPRMRKWLLRKGVFDLKKGLDPFPTSRIIRAGLEIHRMNGYRWLKPSEEVKRAFEDRASNEIENLRRKSKIDWFWNYAALAPLVGLFGTVTGITSAFQQLSVSNATSSTTLIIQHLSSGIFEALWTTIFGLANGIIFILLYYYFKHKLDWIYSKWEDIYISITEKL